MGFTSLGPAASVGGVGTSNLIPSMPPNIQHTWIQTNRRHRVDTVRRAIHALDAQRVLVFMNFQSRLQVHWLPCGCLAFGYASCRLRNFACLSRLTRFPCLQSCYPALILEFAGHRKEAGRWKYASCQFERQHEQRPAKSDPLKIQEGRL